MYTQNKKTFVVCLISDDYMRVMMICSRDGDSPSVADYDFMYHVFSLSLLACFLSFLVWMSFNYTRVTVCVCHAEFIGYLLTYLINLKSRHPGF